GWPVAVADSLGNTAGNAVTFAGSTLLSKDRGTSLAGSGIDTLSSQGGRIAGSDPYTYTPAPLFVGSDVFSYEVKDSAGQTSIGVVRIAVAGDVVAPTVSVSAPLAGATVAGNALVMAAASDAVGVTEVDFFDGLG